MIWSPDLPFDLDITRHDSVFNPRAFNPARVALVGSAEFIAPLFNVLVRLGVQRFALYSRDNLTNAVRLARLAVESEGVHELDVHIGRCKLEDILSGPKSEVLFILHHDYRLVRVLAHFLCSALAATVVFLPYVAGKTFKIATVETAASYSAECMPQSNGGEDLPPAPGLNYVVAGWAAFAFMIWWTEKRSSAGPATRGSILPKFKTVISTSVGLLARRFDASAVDFNSPVDVVGLGALGSWTANVLMLAGFRNVRGFDGDIVDPHNIPNQLFYRSHAKTNKALALERVLHDQGLRGFAAMPRHADFRNDAFSPTVILATDNLKERAMFYRRKNLGSVRTVVDARIGNGNGTVGSSPLGEVSDRETEADKLEYQHVDWRNVRTAGCRRPTLAPLSLIISGLVLNHLMGRLLVGRFRAEGVDEPRVTTVDFLWLKEQGHCEQLVKVAFSGL